MHNGVNGNNDTNTKQGDGEVKRSSHRHKHGKRAIGGNKNGFNSYAFGGDESIPKASIGTSSSTGGAAAIAQINQNSGGYKNECSNSNSTAIGIGNGNGSGSGNDFGVVGVTPQWKGMIHEPTNFVNNLRHLSE